MNIGAVGSCLTLTKTIFFIDTTIMQYFLFRYKKVRFGMKKA